MTFADDSKTEAAKKSAEVWLGMTDGEEYSKSWQNAAEYFRTAVTEDQWLQAMNAVRKPLGKLVSRKLLSAQFAQSLPSAPDGEYVIIQYSSSFENKASAIETVTPIMDKDGKWRVSGYYIK